MGLSGTADKLTETHTAMKWQLLMALVIVYLVMAILFESFVYPAPHRPLRPPRDGRRGGGNRDAQPLPAPRARHAHHARVRDPHRDRRQQRDPPGAPGPCTTCAPRAWNRRPRSSPRRATASARSSCRPSPPYSGWRPSCSFPGPARNFIGDWARWWSGGSPFLPYSLSQSFPPALHRVLGAGAQARAGPRRGRGSAGCGLIRGIQAIQDAPLSGDVSCLTGIPAKRRTRAMPRITELVGAGRFVVTSELTPRRDSTSRRCSKPHGLSPASWTHST